MTTALAISPVRTNLARAVSDMFSPPVAAIPALALGVWASQSTGTCWFALAYFLIAVGLPTAYVVWAVRTGRISDFHMAKRDERFGPFAVSLVCGLGAWLLCLGLGAAGRFRRAGAGAAIADAAAIRDHAVLADQRAYGGHGQPGDVCLPGDWARAAGLLVALVPLVAWARVHLGRHTTAQTIVGACLGTGCFVLLFALHGIAW